MTDKDRKALEPNTKQRLGCEYDFADVLTILKDPRWPTASTDPVLSAVEHLRSATIHLAQAAQKLIRGYETALLANHENDRPEDCPCRACRDRIDAWHLAYHGSLELVDPSDHPKANPMPSERELARS